MRPEIPGIRRAKSDATDVELRDNLIADQESLLNAYRCRFDIDTQLVPQGCPDQPDPDPQPAAEFTAVAAGVEHSCALKTDRTIQCFGEGTTVDFPDGVSWVR